MQLTSYMPMTSETTAETMSTMSVASLNEPMKMLSHDSGGVSASCMAQQAGAGERLEVRGAAGT